MADSWGSIAEETLLAIQQNGETSDVLEARLAFATVAQLRNQHIRPMLGRTRVHPNMMTPQASGRMSVSGPPLGNFTADRKYGPHGIRDVVVPDPGTKWVVFDWEAIEARKIAHYDKDPVDNEAFRREYDIHTVTAIRMFRWPEPSFEPTKKNLFKSDAGLEWCEQIGHLLVKLDPTRVADGKPVPYSDDDRFRRLAKNCRYCLQYAVDEKAMSRYAVEMRMKKEDLFRFGKLYLASKPQLVQWKRQTWADVWRTHEARTWMGRRRRFSGTDKMSQLDVMKEGLNHIIQGGVADLMKLTLRQIMDEWPSARLGWQAHDGAKIVFPSNVDPFPRISQIVEREIEIEGRAIHYPASFETITPHEEN